MLFAISFQNTYCQVFGNLIEKAIQSTVLIKTGNFSGSGILVRDTNSIHLITAKHVIFNEKDTFKTLLSSNAIVQFYVHDFERDSANVIIINLQLAQKDNRLRKDSIHDICILTIAKVEKETGYIKYDNGVFRLGHNVRYDQYYLDQNSIITKNDLYLGEDVFVVGFPGSIGLKKIPQFDYDKPLLKRGAIASTSDKYDNFIIDCSVFHGNSGGPVFLERKDFNNYKLRLIGIASQYIPLLNETLSKKDITVQNSGYAVIVPIEYALKLINE